MRKLPGFAVVCGMAAVCTAPVAAQQLPEAPPGGVPVCRSVTGTADIDGAPQQISGLACQQPDGTWQIQQGDDETLVYPAAAWPDYVDYGPWYGWWPPVFVGASFVFVDHFHHVYPMHQVYYGRPGMHAVSGGHGGFHHGAGMIWGTMGGGHRR